ncbi:MAG: class I fructose-bisphosphate aldolase [Bacilli bacterium]
MKQSMRYNQLFYRNTGRSILFPVDHGTTLGVVPGLESRERLVELALTHGLCGIVAHKGMIHEMNRVHARAHEMRYLLHVSASTLIGDGVLSKQVVSSVAHGLELGVTGMSAHLNFGVDDENEMIRAFGALTDEAYHWGMPVLAMVNLHGAAAAAPPEQKASHLAHIVRVASELGASLVKVQYAGTEEGMARVVAASGVPVLISGGEQTSIELLAEQIRTSLDVGAKGICIGRNIFGASHPDLVCSVLTSLVYEDATVSEALARYYEESHLVWN